MDYNEIFKKHPTDADTRTMGVRYAHYEDIPILFKNWSWDGITASSCIIPLEHLQKANIKRKTIIKILSDKLDIKGETTTSEKDGFLFINFNFKY